MFFSRIVNKTNRLGFEPNITDWQIHVNVY